MEQDESDDEFRTGLLFELLRSPVFRGRTPEAVLMLLQGAVAMLTLDALPLTVLQELDNSEPFGMGSSTLGELPPAKRECLERIGNLMPSPLKRS